MRKAVLFFIFFFIAIAYSSNASSVFAQTVNQKSIKYGKFDPPTPIPTNTLIPVNTIWSPTNDPIISPIPREFIFYSQRDPRWRDYSNPPANTLGECGCGQAVNGMILANTLNQSDNPDFGPYAPIPMWDFFYGKYKTCGTRLLWMLEHLQSYGFNGNIHSWDNTNHAGSLAVLNNYLKNGYFVVLYYYRTWLPDIGHYVILDRLEGQNMIVYDSIKLKNSLQPDSIEPNIVFLGYMVVRR